MLHSEPLEHEEIELDRGGSDSSVFRPHGGERRKGVLDRAGRDELQGGGDEQWASSLRGEKADCRGRRELLGRNGSRRGD